MIVLDTNVISALMRPEANPSIVVWFDRQARALIWTTSISVMEIRTGLLLLPQGQRRDRLTEGFDGLRRGFLRNRILPFDAAAAEAASAIAVFQRRRGMNAAIGDYQIAGIARSCGATLATRNIKDFNGLDVALVDPWN